MFIILASGLICKRTSVYEKFHIKLEHKSEADYFMFIIAFGKYFCTTRKKFENKLSNSENFSSKISRMNLHRTFSTLITSILHNASKLSHTQRLMQKTGSWASMTFWTNSMNSEKLKSFNMKAKVNNGFLK